MVKKRFYVQELVSKKEALFEVFTDDDENDIVGISHGEEYLEVLLSDLKLLVTKLQDGYPEE